LQCCGDQNKTEELLKLSLTDALSIIQRAYENQKIHDMSKIQNVHAHLINVFFFKTFLLDFFFMFHPLCIVLCIIFKSTLILFSNKLIHINVKFTKIHIKHDFKKHKTLFYI